MFFGAIGLTKAVLPHMRERGAGTIVQISSMGGQVVFPGYGAYCATKFRARGDVRGARGRGRAARDPGGRRRAGPVPHGADGRHDGAVARDRCLRAHGGTDAVEAIRAKHAQLAADLEAWEDVSRATDFDT
jgi:hypothetical protein